MHLPFWLPDGGSGAVQGLGLENGSKLLIWVCAEALTARAYSRHSYATVVIGFEIYYYQKVVSAAVNITNID